MFRKNYLILCVFIFCSFFLYSQTTPIIESSLEFSNPRASALGGYHAALTDDIMTIFNNPAGFSDMEAELLISQLTIGLTGPIFDITGGIIGLSENPSDLLADPEALAGLVALISGIYAGIDVVGPLAFAYAGNGISFGLFNWLDSEINSYNGININVNLRENLLFTGGYSFRIPIGISNLDIGLQLKAFFRGNMHIYSTILEMLSIFSTIGDQNFVLSVGGGIDLGLQYSIGKVFSVGVVARDLYTPTMRNKYAKFNDFIMALEPTQENGLIPLDLSGGIRFAPSLGILDRFISNFKILLDYNDILDFIVDPANSKHWLLHLSLGMEFNLLEKLALRGGFSQGLFCAGLGLDLSIFSINASMFGSELSAFPGVRPAYNFVLGLEFKI